MAFVRVGIYPADTSKIPAMMANVEEELYPLYRQAPGFQSLSIVGAGDEIVSISYWDSAEHAEAGVQGAMEWAKTQDGIAGPPVNRIGEELGSS
jgi:heme-degrading monooxygenase HmoA